jgi:hypothetical protein
MIPREEAARGAAVGGEPSRALGELVELRYSGHLAEEDVARLAALEDAIRTVPPGGPWLPLYVAAMEATDAIVRGLERSLESVDREDLELDEQGEAQKKAASRQLSEAQQVRDRVKATFQRRKSEWTDRLRRQRADQMLRPLLDLDSTPLRFVDRERPDQVEVGFHERSWQDYADWIESCRATWAANVCRGVDQQLGEDAAQALGALRGRVAGPPALPPDRQPLGAERAPAESFGLPGAPVAPAVELQGLWSRIGRSLRGPMGMIMMLGMALGAVVPQLVGATERNPNLRYVVMLGALVLLLPVFYVTQRAQARKDRDKARVDRREALKKELARRLDEALARDQGHLERWIARRTETATAGLEQWWAETAEPQLLSESSSTEVALRELRLQKRRIGERRSELTAFLRVPKKLQVDLKKARERWERRESSPS